MTFEQAVELARKNDETGFRFLYESTYRDKYYIALKYMKNEDDALDVLQDAYMKAFTNLSMLYDAGRFPAWLGMIVANTAKNVLVKKKPFLFSEMDMENEDGDSFEYRIEDENFENQPELAYTKEETRELVMQLISSLSEEQRLCILMFHIEGMSIREIATALDCSENTVKSRLNYGRKNLKIKAEELQRKGYKLYGFAPLPILLCLLRVEGAAFLPGAGISELLSYHGFVRYATSVGAALGLSAGEVVAGTGAAGGISGAVGAASFENTPTISGIVSKISEGDSGASEGISGGTFGAGASGTSGGTFGATASGAAGGTSGAAASGATGGIFATVGAKIAVGVIIAALAVTGGATAYYIATKDKDADTEQTVTEETQVAADDTETTEVTTEIVTEEQTEEVTEEEINAEEYAKLYLDVLEAYEDRIRDYNQYRYELSDDYGTQNNYVDSAPVAITDITGDGIPELIFIYLDESSSEYNSLYSLVIYTVKNDQTELIYEEESWDFMYSSGSYYALFKRENDDRLYARYFVGGEGGDEYYYRFDVADDGTLEKVELLEYSYYYNGDYTELIKTYTGDGREIDETTYNGRVENLLSDISELLIYNHSVNDYYEYVYDAEQKYMTYDEAVAYLRQLVGEDEIAEADEPEWMLSYTEVVNDTLSWLTDTQGVDAYTLSEYENFEYVLYDINKDGTPELIIRGYDKEFHQTYQYFFCTYNKTDGAYMFDNLENNFRDILLIYSDQLAWFRYYANKPDIEIYNIVMTGDKIETEAIYDGDWDNAPETEDVEFCPIGDTSGLYEY